jgi:hypothetical protein
MFLGSFVNSPEYFKSSIQALVMLVEPLLDPGHPIRIVAIHAGNFGSSYIRHRSAFPVVHISLSHAIITVH